MTKYKCRKKPSGLYDVTVMTPEGGRTTVRDMTPARKQNLIRIIRDSILNPNGKGRLNKASGTLNR